MALSNLEIQQIVKELKALEGARFQRMQKTAKGYRLKLHGAEVMLAPPDAVYITKYQAKGETDGLSAFVKKRLSGSRLESVEQYGMDRVVTMAFDNGWSVVVELFSTGNLIVVDDEGLTRSALRYQRWSDREIKPKRAYKYPGSRGLDPIDMDANAFSKVFDRDAIRSMVRGVKMSGKYLERACLDAKVAKEKEPSPQDIKKLFKAIKAILARQAEPCLEGEPALFPLAGGGEAKASLSEAVDEYYAVPEPERKQESKYGHRLGEQEKAIGRLEDDAAKYQEAGDWLQSKAPQVEVLLQKVKELRKKGLNDKEISKELGKKVRVSGKKAYLTLDLGKKDNKASADAN